MPRAQVSIKGTGQCRVSGQCQGHKQGQGQQVSAEIMGQHLGHRSFKSWKKFETVAWLNRATKNMDLYTTDDGLFGVGSTDTVTGAHATFIALRLRLPLECGF